MQSAFSLCLASPALHACDCAASTSTVQASRSTPSLQASQEKAIRKKMIEIMTREAETVDLRELVAKFIPESIGNLIEKACSSIYPLQSTYIRKAKILKAPKFDITKLMEVHAAADGGAAGDRLRTGPMGTSSRPRKRTLISRAQTTRRAGAVV